MFDLLSKFFKKNNENKFNSKNFWKEFRSSNGIPEESSMRAHNGLDIRTTANEPEEPELPPMRPERIDFWSYSMHELEEMYKRLFGITPVHKSKEQLVEALITGHIC